MKLTREQIMAARTPKGGWTRKQIETWGLEWPPSRGWIERLTGESAGAAQDISSIDAANAAMRDKIALAVLPAIVADYLANDQFPSDGDNADLIAGCAFAVADAFLARREMEGGGA